MGGPGMAGRKCEPLLRPLILRENAASHAVRRNLVLGMMDEQRRNDRMTCEREFNVKIVRDGGADEKCGSESERIKGIKKPPVVELCKGDGSGIHHGFKNDSGNLR